MNFFTAAGKVEQVAQNAHFFVGLVVNGYNAGFNGPELVIEVYPKRQAFNFANIFVFRDFTKEIKRLSR